MESLEDMLKHASLRSGEKGDQGSERKPQFKVGSRGSHDLQGFFQKNGECGWDRICACPTKHSFIALVFIIPNPLCLRSGHSFSFHHMVSKIIVNSSPKELGSDGIHLVVYNLRQQNRVPSHTQGVCSTWLKHKAKFYSVLAVCLENNTQEDKEFPEILTSGHSNFG